MALYEISLHCYGDGTYGVPAELWRAPDLGRFRLRSRNQTTIPTPIPGSESFVVRFGGVGIICSSFWWSRNRSRNRGDWNRNRSRNRGDWNRSWNRNQMTIPHIYVHVPSNINSGSNLQET